MKKERQKGFHNRRGNAFYSHIFVCIYEYLQSGFFCKSAASDTVCGRSGCQGGCPVQLYSGKKQVF